MNYRLFFLILFLPLWLSGQIPQSKNLTDYVDPFIGTDEDGHTFPGAVVPFGTVQLSPDNGVHGYNWCSGYHYSSNKIQGFSHTHYSGTGAESLCDISLFPLVDVLPTAESVGSIFSHSDEIATPGYYRVKFLESAIKVELTTTMHCGLHRYSIPAGKSSLIRIDLGWGNGQEARVGHNGDLPLECYIKQLNDSTIVGFRRSIGFVGNRKVYFAARTNRPFNGLTIFADGILVSGKRELTAKMLNNYIHFPVSKGEQQLLVKVGISFASIDGALAGLDEVPDWNFDKVRAHAQLLWEKELKKLQVSSPDHRFLKTFYTAVYHNYLAPFHYEDALGQYAGADKKIYSGKNIYTLHSLWDTFRATAPLFMLTQRERVPDIINSYLAFYRQYGLLPSWELYFGEANVMPGYHAVPVIADAMIKGLKGFDYNLALEAMKATANQDIRESDHFRKYGYVPDDLDPRKRGVTKTVEYAFDDWCIAKAAGVVGQPEDSREFVKRSQYWQNVFDSTTGFVRPKDSTGRCIQPFDPSSSTGFQEGNSWIYTWYVPQDIAGLIRKMGGPEAFVAKLDSMYKGPEREHGTLKNHGYYGLSEFSNEPSHHVPYLYAYVGQPWKTAERVRYILRNFYSDQPNGLCGNDDCGQTSAWYIFSSMGFYPVNPANGEFVLGSPLADKVVIALPGGGSFTIRTVDGGNDNIYIQKAVLNGRPYTKTFLNCSVLEKVGELVLYMGKNPSKTWGTMDSDKPGSNDNLMYTSLRK